MNPVPKNESKQNIQNNEAIMQPIGDRALQAMTTLWWGPASRPPCGSWPGAGGEQLPLWHPDFSEVKNDSAL